MLTKSRGSCGGDKSSVIWLSSNLYVEINCNETLDFLLVDNGTNISDSVDNRNQPGTFARKGEPTLEDAVSRTRLRSKVREMLYYPTRHLFLVLVSRPCTSRRIRHDLEAYIGVGFNNKFCTAGKNDIFWHCGGWYADTHLR